MDLKKIKTWMIFGLSFILFFVGSEFAYADDLSSKIPDENFRKCLTSVLKEGRKDYIGTYTGDTYTYYLTTDEKSYDFTEANLDKVRTIYCEDYGIKDLTGINLLTNLEYLYVNNNSISTFNLSNPKLKLIYAAGNKYKSLSVSDGVAKQLTDLSVSYNNLTKSVIDGYMTRFPNLKLFAFGGDNYSGELNVSSLTNLDKLWIENNNVTSIKGLTSKITILSLHNNPISNFDLSAFPELYVLSVGKTKFSSVDVSKNPKLKYLRVDDLLLDSINLKNNPELYKFYANYNNFTSIDFSNNKNLIYIDVGVNLLNSLDVSMLTKLKSLYARNNRFSSINLGSSSELLDLDVNWCKNLSSLTLDSKTKLKYLNIAGVSKINNLNLTSFSGSLEKLIISLWQAQKYDFRGLSKLTDVSVSSAIHVPIYNQSSSKVSQVLNYLPSGLSISSLGSKRIVDRTKRYYSYTAISGDDPTINGEIGKNVSVDIVDSSGNYTGLKVPSSAKVQYTLNSRFIFHKLTSSKYSINEEKGTIDVGGDDDATILKNLNLVDDLSAIKMNISGDKLILSSNVANVESSYSGISNTYNFKTFTLLRVSNPKTGSISFYIIMGILFVGIVCSVLGYLKLVKTKSDPDNFV